MNFIGRTIKNTAADLLYPVVEISDLRYRPAACEVSGVNEHVTLRDCLQTKRYNVFHKLTPFHILFEEAHLPQRQYTYSVPIIIVVAK